MLNCLWLSYSQNRPGRPIVKPSWAKTNFDISPNIYIFVCLAPATALNYFRPTCLSHAGPVDTFPCHISTLNQKKKKTIAHTRIICNFCMILFELHVCRRASIKSQRFYQWRCHKAHNHGAKLFDRVTYPTCLPDSQESLY